MEDKETSKSLPPNDIDVVTFFEIPEGKTQIELSTAHPELFNHGHVKATYLVDSYTHQIGMPMKRFDVRQVSYWYSMWSHRKNGMWKGFVQVDLSKTDDQVALSLLQQIEREGAQQ